MASKKRMVSKPAPGELAPSRAGRGRTRDGAGFPAPPSHAGMPPDYLATLGEIKERIRSERLRDALAANAAMVRMYWEIGRIILARQAAEGWGAKVIDRLAADLREEFPDMRGLSPRTLKYMRKFAEAWPDAEIVQGFLAQLPWWQNIDLLFYHLKLRCFVVVELKAVPFEPEFVGKLNMYMGAVDDLLRHPDDRPTIGLLLCKGKGRIIAEYALNGFTRPIGVADWKKQLTETLPTELRGSLPTVEEIEAELSEVAERAKQRASRNNQGDSVREPRARYGADAVRIVDQPCDVTDGADTPFGRRWGGDVAKLTPAHLAAIKAGKTLALDVQNEYVLFVQAQSTPSKRPARRKGGRDG